MHGQRFAVILNNSLGVVPQDLQTSEYIIMLETNNVNDLCVSKFVAFIVRSFQKYQTVLDVSLGRNSNKPMARGKMVRCDIYEFINTTAEVYDTRCDCVLQKM